MISNAERLDLIELLDEIKERVGEPGCSQWPDGYHPEHNENVSLQKQICNACPVRDLCLTYAMKWDVTGVWGGTTTVERMRLKRIAGIAALDKRRRLSA